jgi:hypothetical protein
MNAVDRRWPHDRDATAKKLLEGVVEFEFGMTASEGEVCFWYEMRGENSVKADDATQAGGDVGRMLRDVFGQLAENARREAEGMEDGEGAA